MLISSNWFLRFEDGSPVPLECAIKVVKTTLNEFFHQDKNINNDYHFKTRFSKQNLRKIVKIWAEKEMYNLKRCVHCTSHPPSVFQYATHLLHLFLINICTVLVLVYQYKSCPPTTHFVYNYVSNVLFLTRVYTFIPLNTFSVSVLTIHLYLSLDFRLHGNGIPCPEVVLLHKHVLIMRFIGKDMRSAPKLKDVQLNSEQWKSAYHQCIQVGVVYVGGAHI